MKFEPTTEPGIFLGYVIHPGFHWRKEFAVASLKQINDADFDQSVTVLRVLKVSIPEKIEFPCRKRADAIREGILKPNQLCDDQDALPPPEEQDAQPVREPGPAKRTITDIEAGQPALQSSASAVYHQGWLEFFKHVDHKEAWYEYANCKVNVRIIDNQCIGPSPDFDAADFPFRTTCIKDDESWHVHEENLKIDPPVEDLEKDIEVHEVIVTIFSKEPIDLRNRVDEPIRGAVPDEEVEVINPITGELERIRTNDPSYYDAGGFKARKYKNSSKPKDIPPFVWQAMSQKERRASIADEQRKLALEEKEKKRAKRVKAVPMIGTLKESPNELEEYLSYEFIPAMPVCQMNPQKHRTKCIRLGIQSGEKTVNTLVARPVGKKEIRANPKAQQALDVEWEKLVKKKAWQYETVAEWKVIADKAKKTGKKVHVGKVFEICVEKGSELPEGDKLRKFKGRTVFQGNNVKDESSDVALFSELGSSPATMEAGKAVDAYGAQPGFITQQNDGVQAYTQALWKGVETWVELPPDRWPKEWYGKFIRPVVLLRIALYGHPDSGGLWEQYCEAMLKLVGFIMPDPEGWPSVFFHPELKLLLVVYVDDFKMSGPKENMSKGWSLIASKIDMDTPGEVNRYLGCDHVAQHNVKLKVEDHPYAHVFDKSLADPAAPAAAACHRTQDFWELDTVNDVYMRHHVQPRKKLFMPDEEVVKTCHLAPFRFTNAIPCNNNENEVEQWDTIGIGSNVNKGGSLNESWVGTTYFFPTSCKDPKAAMATIKRDKSGAKKKARAEGFSYMDQLFENQPCMQKPVTTFTYDMEPFLKSCVDRYLSLAGRDAKPLKQVSTPFHEERIARPIADEKETKGVLAPIAARVLMKVLFAARMARFDLLRAVQGLAARVTKWSAECDKALHRLICYINSTLDHKQRAFIGDKVSECRLWLFADADHAGEYDNRSTSGCLLVLVGPNTYFPLTAFSKKQTAVAMSSTESEVVSANVSLRAVGLPSSGLWAYLQNAGGERVGKDSIPGGLPRHDIETQKEPNGEYWQFMRSRRLLIRVHTKPRSHLFTPIDMSKSPINLKRIGCARTTVMLKDRTVDFMQDNWKVKVDYPINGEWTGKTFFRVYGPYESDYNIESVEIREAITDYEFVGREKEGECMISMFSPRSIKGVFVEDNQATIRILENGKSPTFRHTDKTQRVNLSWLEEQFKRRWYKLVHGPSMLQAADILTKPFVSAEKWRLAVKLLALTPTKKATPQKALASATEAIIPPSIAAPSTGGPAAKSDTKRLIVEVCCHPESKLSQTNRKWSEGCEVLQFTEEFDLNEVENQMRIAEYVNSFKGDVKPFIWISLPCTGGTPWTYINMKNPSAREKVLKHVREFDRLWISLKSFLRMLNCEVHIALEWPRKCRYWKLAKVAKLLSLYEMIAYHFDGCALGMVNQDNDPLKKPWTVATNHAGVGRALSKFQCTCNRRHAPGRGIALKKTEEYTFRMTDAIHKALTRQHPALKLTCCALIAPFRSPVVVMLTRAIQMAKACAVAGRPAILERITQWEGVVNTLKGAIAVATWDDPQVLLREMEGCRLWRTLLSPCLAVETRRERTTRWLKFSKTPLTATWQCALTRREARSTCWSYQTHLWLWYLTPMQERLRVFPEAIFSNPGETSEAYIPKCCGARDWITWSSISPRPSMTSSPPIVPMVARFFRCWSSLGGPGMMCLAKGVTEVSIGFTGLPTTNLLPTGRSRPTGVSGKRPGLSGPWMTWASSNVRNPESWTSWLWGTLTRTSLHSRRPTTRPCASTSEHCARTTISKPSTPPWCLLGLWGTTRFTWKMTPSIGSMSPTSFKPSLIATFPTSSSSASTIIWGHFQESRTSRSKRTTRTSPSWRPRTSLKSIRMSPHRRIFLNDPILRRSCLMRTSKFSTGCFKLRRTPQPLPTGRSSPGWETFLKKTRHWNQCIRTTLIRMMKLSRCRLSPWKTEFRQGGKASPKSMTKSGKTLPMRPRMKRRSSRAGTPAGSRGQWSSSWRREGSWSRRPRNGGFAGGCRRRGVPRRRGGAGRGDWRWWWRWHGRDRQGLFYAGREVWCTGGPGAHGGWWTGQQDGPELGIGKDLEDRDGPELIVGKDVEDRNGPEHIIGEDLANWHLSSSVGGSHASWPDQQAQAQAQSGKEGHAQKIEGGIWGAWSERWAVRHVKICLCAGSGVDWAGQHGRSSCAKGGLRKA